MLMKRNLVLVIFLLFMLPGMGQKKWTLEDCIKYAIENNLDIKRLAISSEKAAESYHQSKWNMLPSFGASSSAGYSFGRSVVEGDLVTKSYFYNDYNLGASLELFNAFSVQNQISYTKFLKESAENSKLNAVNNLAFEVMNYFFDVIYYNELLRITNEQKDLSLIIERKTEVLVNTGLKSTSELLEVKANLEKDILTCIQTGNLRDASLIKLKKAMNLNPDSTMILLRNSAVVIAGFQEESDIKSVYNAYSGWSPLIKALEYDWKASGKYLSMQRSGCFPSLTTNASYGTYFYPSGSTDGFRYQLKANQSQYLGLSLRIPVFNRNLTQTSVRLAKLDYESARTKLEQAKRDTYYDVLTNYNDLKASLSEYGQEKKQLEADTLAFRASEKKYMQGMISVIDFYTAKNRMANTEGQLLRAGMSADIKMKIIDFYRGNRFWEK